VERHCKLTNLRTQSFIDDEVPLPRLARLLANVSIISLWIWLYRPLFDYLTVIFTRDDFRTNQIVLAGVVVLIVVRLRKEISRPRFDALPQLYLPALAFALGGSLLYLACERFLDINTVSASLFGLASYGLLGLWMKPQRWRQGLPAALLLIGTLPFGEHMQTFIGYPVRLVTAVIVRDGLARAGVASLGVDTILVFENGVSHVDLPCSGVKSLWAGALFLIAATWVERRRLNLRWLLTLLVFGVLLFAANLIRVAVLTVIGEVAEWRLLAEMLHVPLGVLGFAGACAAAIALLRWFCREGDSDRGSSRIAPIGRPVWLSPVLAVAILAMALAYTPRPQTVLAQSADGWELPGGLVTEPSPLQPEEIEWLTRDGAESASRYRFDWRGKDAMISGSVIFISSTTWRAHHNPERCLMLYGLSLDDSHTHLVRDDFPVRYTSLGANRGAGRSLQAGTYWFQSAGRTTDDYATRIWADVALDRDRWVLVSILFDDVYDPRDADVEAFYVALHEVVNANLGGDDDGDRRDGCKETEAVGHTDRDSVVDHARRANRPGCDVRVFCHAPVLYERSRPGAPRGD
jgi:exosortase O